MTTQRFQRIATSFADLNADGLNAQAVNVLLTMYVDAASQHVLRMSFVPEQEAYNFDGQVTTIWSHLIQRKNHHSVVFLTRAAAPWRAWQSIIPALMATTQ